MAEAKPTANQIARRAGELAAAEENLTRNLKTLQDEVDRYLNNISSLTVLRFGIGLDPVAVSAERRAQMRDKFVNKVIANEDELNIRVKYIAPQIGPNDENLGQYEEGFITLDEPNIVYHDLSEDVLRNPFNRNIHEQPYYFFPSFLKSQKVPNTDKALDVANDLVNQFKEFVNKSKISKTEIDLDANNFNSEAQKRIKINQDPYGNVLDDPKGGMQGLNFPVGGIIKNANLEGKIKSLPSEVQAFADVEIPELPDLADVISVSSLR